MQPALEIRGSGRAFVILHQGQTVAGPYTSNDNAVAALRGVERRLAPQSVVSFRKCGHCGQGFLASAKRPGCPYCSKRRRHG